MLNPPPEGHDSWESWLTAMGVPEWLLLVFLSLLCKELAAECEREAGLRFSEG